MANPNPAEFRRTLTRLREKAGKSEYIWAKHSEIDEGYIGRLESGERCKPSWEVVMRIAVALMIGQNELSIHEVTELLLAAGYAPIRRRGE